MTDHDPTPADVAALAARVLRTQESASIAVADRARRLRAEGRRIISLAIGEPDFETPKHVKLAAVDALLSGMTRYTNVDGTADLKRAICEKFERENGLRYRESEVHVAAGAKQAIFNALLAVLEDDDEVLVPAPYWVSYPEMVTFVGARPVVVPTTVEAGFKLTPDALRRHLTARTRVLLVNSPNNPSGAVYDAHELRALAEVLRAYPRVLVISDDIYEHIRWTDAPFHNLASAAPDLRDRVLVVNGVSKAYAMTGWRIGYAAGPVWLIDAMRKIQSQSTSNPNAIAQHAAAVALRSGLATVETMTQEFRRRHDYLVDALQQVPGVTCARGAGAFYAFPDVGGLMRNTGSPDDLTLSQRLLEEAGLAVVPGSAYGMPGFLRLSFATSLDELRAAVDALTRFAERGGAAR